ncbi:hypothetical protein ACFL20_12080 [Spirochaetota bacterium]
MKRACLLFLTLLAACSFLLNSAESASQKDYDAFIGASAGYGIFIFEKTSQYKDGGSIALRGGYYFSDNFGFGGLFAYNPLSNNSRNLAVGAQFLMRFFSGFHVDIFIGMNSHTGDSLKGSLTDYKIKGTDSYNEFAYGCTIGYDWLFSSIPMSLGIELFVDVSPRHDPIVVGENFSISCKYFF